MRHTRQPLCLIAVACVLTVVTACDSSGPQPVAPTPTPVSPASSAPPAAVYEADAPLAVSSFTLRRNGFANGVYWYRPSLVLTETSGTSAARLASFEFIHSGQLLFLIVNNSAPGTGCFLTPESQVVPAGGSWSLDSLYGYCLDIDSPVELSSLDVIVTVVDDNGRRGTASGSAVVVR